MWFVTFFIKKMVLCVTVDRPPSLRCAPSLTRRLWHVASILCWSLRPLRGSFRPVPFPCELPILLLSHTLSNGCGTFSSTHHDSCPSSPASSLLIPVCPGTRSANQGPLSLSIDTSMSVNTL